jgi:hypothetical protein
VWAFLRSFLWIPFIGLVPAFILYPRFRFAPIILMNEHKGVMKSVSMSFARSRGYWGKIIGNGMVIGLCIVLCVAPFSILAGVATATVGYGWVWKFLGQLVALLGSAYATVFTTRLAETCTAHPRNA